MTSASTVPSVSALVPSVSSPPGFLSRVQVPIQGFNMSLLRRSTGGFLATVRRTGNNYGTVEGKTQPRTKNQCWLAELGDDFRLVSLAPIKQDAAVHKPLNPLNDGWEDARLVSETAMLAVTHDTNRDCRPEVSLVRFSPSTMAVTSVQPIRLRPSGDLAGPEKNWLCLRRWGDEFHLLYGYKPLRVLRYNSDSGVCKFIADQAHSAADLDDAHGAACVHLPDRDRFLVGVRCYRSGRYAFSRWLLLTDGYDLCGISDPFRFQMSGYYEMNMSLTLVKDKLIAAVSIDDRDLFLYTFSIEALLASIHPV